MAKELIKKFELVNIYLEDGVLFAETELANHNMVVTFKNIKKIAGHDDSLPFMGSFYINGKRVGEAHNDGWGGECSYSFVGKNSYTYGQLEEIAKQYQWSWLGDKHNYDTFNSILDELACEVLSVADINKKVKSLTKKYCLVGLLPNLDIRYLNLSSFCKNGALQKIVKRWEEEEVKIVNLDKFQHLL